VPAAVETIVEAGGTVILKLTQIPVDRLADVNGPFGNALVLLDLSAGRYVTDVDGPCAWRSAARQLTSPQSGSAADGAT
jgi:hypothetical protein